MPKHLRNGGKQRHYCRKEAAPFRSGFLLLSHVSVARLNVLCPTQGRTILGISSEPIDQPLPCAVESLRFGLSSDCTKANARCLRVSNSSRTNAGGAAETHASLDGDRLPQCVGRCT